MGKNSILYFGVFVGFYSHLIFLLGILKILKLEYIYFLTLVYVLIWGGFYIRTLHGKRIRFAGISIINAYKQNATAKVILTALTLITLLGVFSPEISFDALWYHLTLPKIFLAYGGIFYIPGNLYYYSTMPKLAEMLYVIPVAFSFEQGAKLMHFLFGVGTCVLIYNISRQFLNKKLSLLAVLVFYSNLVVLWLSASSYIDLVRAFFETGAIWSIFLFAKTRETKYILFTSLLLGFAISTKIISVVFVILFVILSIIFFAKEIKQIKNINIYLLSILLLVISAGPWITFSYVTTGNPFYPLFSEYLNSASAPFFNLTFFNPVYIVKTYWTLFIKAADPINPIYLLIIPLVIKYYKNFPREIKFIVWNIVGSFLFWFIISKFEGSRLIVSTLPIFSVLTIYAIKNTNKLLNQFFVLLIVLLSVVSLLYRIAATTRYADYLFIKHSKSDFLVRNLNFSFGDFYDVDGYFKKNLSSKDTVLIIGSHNLYYTDFPFIHESYIKKGDKFNYILTQDAGLPPRFADWFLIYKNDKTHVKLYTKDMGLWGY